MDMAGNRLLAIQAVHPAEDFFNYYEDDINAIRLIFDIDEEEFVDITPLYNSAIEQYNEENEASYDTLDLFYDAYHASPFYTIGVI